MTKPLLNASKMTLLDTSDSEAQNVRVQYVCREVTLLNRR